MLALCSCSKNSTDLSSDLKSLQKEVKWARYQQGKTKLSDKAIFSADDLDYYEISNDFKVKASFKKSNSTETLNIPTYSGIQKEFYHFGTASFAIKGFTYQLNIYKNIIGIQNKKYKDYLFLPFMDQTNGEETYGGGRYIDLKTGDIKDGFVIIDFNRAYNPYCAYGDGWNCPIPPVENHLKTEIKAGEKSYQGPKKNRILEN